MSQKKKLRLCSFRDLPSLHFLPLPRLRLRRYTWTRAVGRYAFRGGEHLGAVGQS